MAVKSWIRNICIATFAFCMMLSELKAQTVNIVSNENTGWQKIALTTVNFEQNEKDILIAGREKYLSIYFRVATGQVDLKSLLVYFENGDKQDIAINEIVKTAANSRVFDFNGEGRIIKKLVLKYDAVAKTDDHEARLEVWASQLKRSR